MSFPGLVALAFCTGMGVGILFTLLKLPLPAPPSLVGVMGIVGIYIGYVVIHDRDAIIARIRSMIGA